MIGILMILAAALVVTSPFWTFLLVVVGLVMVLTAWVGSRLEGHFAIEWGDAGAAFEMTARFKAAPQLRAGTAVEPAASPSGPDALAPQGKTADDEVIDGEAHTIELNLDEFKALIAAAEAGYPAADRGEGQPEAEVLAGLRHPEGEPEAEVVADLRHPAADVDEGQPGAEVVADLRRDGDRGATPHGVSPQGVTPQGVTPQAVTPRAA